MRPLRTIVSIGASLAALLLLAGCGGGATVLTEGQLQSALITIDNLGGGFVEAADDEETETSLGCLEDLADGDSLVADAASKSEVDYEAGNDAGIPAVFAASASFEEVGHAEEVLSAFEEALGDCSHVDEADSEGTRTKLDVSGSDEEAIEGVDGQFALRAVGEISSGGISFPVSIIFHVTRLDNNIAATGFVALSGDASDEASEIAQLAADRLNDIIAGEEPSGEVVDVPTE